MRDCSTQVTKFFDEEVALPGDERNAMRERRNSNRTRLKNGLAKNGKPKPVGCHTQGSYAMRTMVQDAESDYDIDDGVYFKDADLVGPNGGKMTALQVRQMVCEAVQDGKFKTAPEVLKNCVRVYYDEGFHVDIPAYRRIETKNWWDGKVTCTYELASSDWKQSDPKEVTNWFKKENERLSPDPGENGGQFRRVVRMLKKFARSRSSWKSRIASGFMITKLASEEFYASAGRDDVALRETMKAIKARLDWNTTVQHPVLEGATLTHDDDGRPGYLRDRLEENLKHLEALDQADCTHEQAMAAWDKVFNTDWFSGQPAPEGTKSASWTQKVAAAAAPSKPVEKKGGGRYA